MFSLRVDSQLNEKPERNFVLQKIAGDSDDEIITNMNKERIRVMTDHPTKGKPRDFSNEKRKPDPILSHLKYKEDLRKQTSLLAPFRGNPQETEQDEPSLQKRAFEEPTVYLCKLARNIEGLDSSLRIIEESNELDKACKKLKTELLTRDVVKKLSQMTVNVPQQSTESPSSPVNPLSQNLSAPLPPSQFESATRNVFLLRRAERDDLLEQIRTTSWRERLQQEKQEFQAKQKNQVVYFDQSTNQQKLMDIEEISDPAFRQSLVRIQVKPASEVQESLLQRVRTDLQSSELAEHLVSDVLVPDIPKSEKTHSRDSNSENATGNDYGPTPSSRSRGSDDSDEDSQEFDDPRIKKLYQMMEPNKKKKHESDSDNDSGSEGNLSMSDSRSHGKMSNELEPKRNKHRGGNKTAKNRKKKENYLTVAQDAWYTRGDDEET